jgi:hypothetical protein
VFVAERRLQCLSQSKRAILHGVMLVDVQISGAGQLQREPAVLRDLLQHVIEKADAGGDANRCCFVEPDFDVDVRFLRLARDARRAARDWRKGIVCNPNALDAELARELQVCVALADEAGLARIDLSGAQVAFEELRIDEDDA